jgi:hypothetical protein
MRRPKQETTTQAPDRKIAAKKQDKNKVNHNLLLYPLNTNTKQENMKIATENI